MNMEKFIHMQRYYKTIAIMLICSLLLTGCTTRNSGQEDDAEVKTSYEFNADKSQVSEKSRSAYSENGYYYLMNGILWFYDINNNIATVVCSNANCEHKDENCNAYLMDEHNYDPLDLAGVTVKGLGNQLWYIDGYIYTLLNVMKVEIILFSMIRLFLIVKKYARLLRMGKYLACQV